MHVPAKVAIGCVVAFLLVAWIAGLEVRHRQGAGSAKPTSSPAAARSVITGGVVTRVVDGDTINVQGVGSIRFLGIDAPETHDQTRAGGKVVHKGCYGIAAKVRLGQLLPLGTPVTLVTEAKEKDRYGRTLAYVERDGMDVGEQMMREGLADFYEEKRAGVDTVVPFGRQARYEDAWHEAEFNVVGIHNPRCQP